MTLLPCLTPAQLRCYIAVCQLWDRDGRVTCRSLVKELGLTSTGSMSTTLAVLCREGLIAKADRVAATIRPLYRVTVFTSPSRGGAAGEGSA